MDGDPLICYDEDESIYVFNSVACDTAFAPPEKLNHFLDTAAAPLRSMAMSWAGMLKKQEGHWFVRKEHRYRRSSRYQERAWS